MFDIMNTRIVRFRERIETNEVLVPDSSSSTRTSFKHPFKLL
jgi:hypothetical protein